MTAQTPEVLIHRGQELALYAQPLYDRLTRIPKAKRPIFAPPSTSCWRGYVGTWEIRDGVLTLIALQGWLKRGDEVVDASLDLAFPKAKGALAATWFTGAVECVEGRMLRYVHAGFASTYERHRIFVFEKGRIVGEYIQLNPPPAVFYRIDQDGSRTCVDSAHPQAYVIADPLDGAPFETVYDRVWSRRPGPEYEIVGPLAETRLG